ncbi:hypothetical protein MKW94_006751, partial [Papaver nudicaule]|nr:hypothetical protein [Papaver nudicaule]
DPIIANIGTKKKDVERTKRSGELKSLTKSKSGEWSVAEDARSVEQTGTQPATSDT